MRDFSSEAKLKRCPLSSKTCVFYEQGVMVQERRQLHDEARLKQIEGFLVLPHPLYQTYPVETLRWRDGNRGRGVIPGKARNRDYNFRRAQGKLDLASTHMAAGRQAFARVIPGKRLWRSIPVCRKWRRFVIVLVRRGSMVGKNRPKAIVLSKRSTTITANRIGLPGRCCQVNVFQPWVK